MGPFAPSPFRPIRGEDCGFSHQQSVVKQRVAPRAARLPADKARRGSILDIFDRGAT